MSTTFITAWNARVVLSRHAIPNPSAVNVAPTRPAAKTATTAPPRPGRIPTNGASAPIRTAWRSASVVPPRTTPRTIARRGCGATSAACNTPDWRSSTTEMVE